jgi:endonuclease YncB( thermonuclease family)
LGLYLVLAILVITPGCKADKVIDQPGNSAIGVAQTYPHYADRTVHVERSRIKIDDGDTIEIGQLVIRILGLDTPEIRNPEHGFYEDQPYGREAMARAVELFGAAQVIEYVADSLDSYGRTLAHVFLDGECFAVKMIEARLAYESVSFYGDNGFPDLAELILAAADKAGRPPFQEPYIWRRENRRNPAPAGF